MSIRTAIWPNCRQTSPHAWLHTLILVDVGLKAPVEATWGLLSSCFKVFKNSTKAALERAPLGSRLTGCSPLGLHSAPPSLSPAQTQT